MLYCNETQELLPVVSEKAEHVPNELKLLYEEVGKQNVTGMHLLLLPGFDKLLQEGNKLRKELAVLQA